MDNESKLTEARTKALTTMLEMREADNLIVASLLVLAGEDETWIWAIRVVDSVFKAHQSIIAQLVESNFTEHDEMAATLESVIHKIKK